MYKILFLGLLLSVSALGQETKVKFGEVSLDDIKMRAYPQDSSADAVVLYDFGETTYEVRGQTIYIVLNYHGRIKILKKSAFSRATINVGFYKGSFSNQEFVSGIKGFTHNVANEAVQKDKLTKEMIFLEKSSDNYSTYKFTLPNVKEGSVIEYSYTISTPINVSILK